MTNRDYYGYVSDGMTLYHHGILGMHWGIRRFQPYPKGHTGGKEVGAAKRQTRLDKIKEKTELQKAKNEYQQSKHESKLEEAQSKLDVATAKASLQRVQNAPKQGAVPQTDAKREALKQKIIRSGDPKLIRQYESMLTNDEYRQAKDRMTMRNELQKSIRDNKFNKQKDLIDKFSSGIGSIGNAVENIKNTYNKVADVQNFLNPNKKWKKIENKKPDYAEQQKRTAAAKAREDFRQSYGFDPYTGNRAKAIYKPDGTFLRYAYTEEEATGIIRENTNLANQAANTPNSFIGPQPMNRRYTMV